MSELVAKPFSPDELHLLQSTLDPSVVAWATDSPNIREYGRNRLIRDLAAMHALGKVVLARGIFRDFEGAISLGCDVDTQYPKLRYYNSPAKMGGSVAGHLAIAKLMTTWYGLERPDFTRLPTPPNRVEFAKMSTELLQAAVCNTPKDQEITSFSAHDVFLETLSEAQNAIRANGSVALSEYMDFPECPIRPGL